MRAFLHHDEVEYYEAVLRESARRHGVNVLAYCFMPDHLHLLVHNVGDGSAVEFVRHFKQLTGYRFKQRTGGALWQKSYYDHFLRREEEVLTAARYIFGNPVRTGLVGRAADYPFSGSFVWDRAVVEG